MCRVLNARQGGKQPATDRVYVGRPSKWGNPLMIGRDGTHDQVIAKYRDWIVRQPALMGRWTSCAASISSAGARPSAAMRRF